MKGVRFILLFVTGLFLAHIVHADSKVLVLTTGISAPLVKAGDTDGFVESIAIEAFKRAGVIVKIDNVPSKLSLINANSGKDDGVVLRIGGLEKTYPNLVRVPEFVMCSEFSAYSKFRMDGISTWDSLHKYNVSFVNGWRVFENNISNFSDIRRSDSAKSIFNMLKQDRTEVVLYEKWQGAVLAEDLGMVGLYANKLPIEQMKMYMYLHNKHASLVGNIASRIKEMKTDGTYQKIFDKTLVKYIGQDDEIDKSYQKHVLQGCQ